MIHDNETNNQTSGLHDIAEQQKQLSRPSEYTLPHPFSMRERPKNIDRDDVPSRDVNRRVGGDEKFGVKYEKKKYFDVCNNCGKQGHTFKQCKNPITSFGVIVFRINPLQQREYLMIRRKDTLGYIDFMRGKYSASNQKYIFNMIEQMTIQEKYKLKKYTFDELWHDLWIEEHSLLSTEDGIQPDASTTLALPKTTASSGKGLQASSLLTRQVTLSPNEFGQRAFTPSHSGLRPPNTTKFIDDLRSEDRRSSTFWSEDRRSSTFWSSEDFGTTKNKTSYRRQKEDAIFILINTLPITSQHCLIPKTIPCHMEEKIINDILNDVNVQPCQYYIVLYGKHSTDDAVDKKYRQLIQLGFTNVFIYYGGLFEWMLLRDIYGEDKFPLHISDNKKDTYGCGNAYSEGRRRSPEEYVYLYTNKWVQVLR